MARALKLEVVCRPLSVRPAPVAQRRLFSVRAADEAPGKQVAESDKKDLNQDIVFKPFDEVRMSAVSPLLWLIPAN